MGKKKKRTLKNIYPFVALVIGAILFFWQVSQLLCLVEATGDCHYYRPYEYMCIFHKPAFYEGGPMKSLEIRDSVCVDNLVSIKVRNVGVDAIDVDGAYLNISDASKGSRADLAWTDESGNEISTIGPGAFAVFKTQCDGNCVYDITICEVPQWISVKCN